MKLTTILSQPFEKLQERTLLSIGVLSLFIFSLIAYFGNGRFNGVLDFHLGSQVSLYQPFVDNIINTIILTIILYLYAKKVNEKSRFVDLLNIALISRIPIYLVGLFAMNSINQEATKVLLTLPNPAEILQHLSTVQIIMIIVTAILTLSIYFFTGYYIYHGFKTATNAKKQRQFFLLIPLILLVEIITKVLTALY